MIAFSLLSSHLYVYQCFFFLAQKLPVAVHLHSSFNILPTCLLPDLWPVVVAHGWGVGLFVAFSMITKLLLIASSHHFTHSCVHTVSHHFVLKRGGSDTWLFGELPWETHWFAFLRSPAWQTASALSSSPMSPSTRDIRCSPWDQPFLGYGHYADVWQPSGSSQWHWREWVTELRTLQLKRTFLCV